MISSSSVPRFSIPRLPCQLKSRDESVDGFKKTILRCGQKRLLCPTEGTVESFPVLECPEEGWVCTGLVGCTERRKEPRMTVELVDSGMFTLVQYNLDSIALIAFTDLSQQQHYSSPINISTLQSCESYTQCQRFAGGEKRDQTMKSVR